MSNQYVMDNQGKLLKITNLSEAIAQAALFKEFKDKERPDLSAELQKYWGDLHKSLLQIENQNKKSLTIPL